MTLEVCERFIKQFETTIQIVSAKSEELLGATTPHPMHSRQLCLPDGIVSQTTNMSAASKAMTDRVLSTFLGTQLTLEAIVRRSAPPTAKYERMVIPSDGMLVLAATKSISVKYFDENDRLLAQQVYQNVRICHASEIVFISSRETARVWAETILHSRFQPTHLDEARILIKSACVQAIAGVAGSQRSVSVILDGYLIEYPSFYAFVKTVHKQRDDLCGFSVRGWTIVAGGSFGGGYAAAIIMRKDAEEARHLKHGADHQLKALQDELEFDRERLRFFNKHFESTRTLWPPPWRGTDTCMIPSEPCFVNMGYVLEYLYDSLGTLFCEYGICIGVVEPVGRGAVMGGVAVTTIPVGNTWGHGAVVARRWDRGRRRGPGSRRHSLTRHPSSLATRNPSATPTPPPMPVPTFNRGVHASSINATVAMAAEAVPESHLPPPVPFTASTSSTPRPTSPQASRTVKQKPNPSKKPSGPLSTGPASPASDDSGDFMLPDVRTGCADPQLFPPIRRVEYSHFLILFK
ncbi:hypothetical protein BDK51DRAFT_43547 [Blyttiomyces helicus]|uniref:Uncharacterized protein n=1 Tax=Blyttiomyces helicus TaxID=388810 RepID=A0A4P9WRW2_9FUNG|nr:hypothetical protein BDK51DRAFT_43547 [Blyttiomyces helicus]|eukprot:RKO94658.1 hypothetical protein BDK51DRAFT_43547 [Blyttiomyces helicus]